MEKLGGTSQKSFVNVDRLLCADINRAFLLKTGHTPTICTSLSNSTRTADDASCIEHWRRQATPSGCLYCGSPDRTQCDEHSGHAGAAHDDQNSSHFCSSTNSTTSLPSVQPMLFNSPTVPFFCVTRTVLAPALAEAAAASQPACPPPTTTTSTPVGTSW